MKTTRQIAEETADRIEPGLSRSIADFADSKHPELVRGRESLIRRRQAIIAFVEAAIEEACRV